MFLDLLKQISKKQESIKLFGRMDDFDSFFDAVTKTKKIMGIHNSAVALRTMAQLTLQKLEEIEQEAQNVSPEG